MHKAAGCVTCKCTQRSSRGASEAKRIYAYEGICGSALATGLRKRLGVIRNDLEDTRK